MPDEPAEPKSLALAADFPTPHRDEWRALVTKVLARSGVDEDADPETALAHTTYDGITIAPLYTADDAPGHRSYVRSTAGDATGWQVTTRHADPDVDRVNAAILNDLETGATSLWLVLGRAGIAIDDLGAALKDVYLDLAPIVLDAGSDVVAAASTLLAAARDRGVDLAQVRGSFGADPVGTHVRTGDDLDLGSLPALVEQGADLPGMRVATVDGSVYHGYGASDAQEIGIATWVGVAYLRALVDGGLPLGEALGKIDFRFAVTAEQFPSIAKLRAARRVWARVAELSGASDDERGQYQHAVTSEAMLTRRDPWVNLLRATIGCFAAAVGGADAITVLPFDHAIGIPDDFSRRIARNTQSVLHDESSLARVSDPAGGSWFVDSLTDRLAEQAWDVFTGLERADGLPAALDEVRTMIDGVRTARADDVEHRRRPITGVSEFAFVDEKPVEREPWPQSPTARGSLFGPSPLVRWAGRFEALRDLADARPERPKIFLATLGPPAVNSARAGFAANLFQAGGFECVRGEPNKFAQSGAKIACLCSSDKIYADEAEPAAKTLRDAGATRIWLAGKGDVDGVDGTIFAGCDALRVLREAMLELGLPVDLEEGAE